MAARSFTISLFLSLALYFSASSVRYNIEVEDDGADEVKHDAFVENGNKVITIEEEEQDEKGLDAVKPPTLKFELKPPHHFSNPWAGSPCSGSFIEEFKAKHPKKYRVAVIIGERLNRLPKRVTERMNRFATSLEGADLFVVTEEEDKDVLPFIRPKPKKVGFFNRTVVGVRANGKHIGQHIRLNVGATVQLLRTRDAFELIRKQEKEQGYKYDVVARLRTESVMLDACMTGLNEGCMKPGAWSYAMAAHVMSDNKSTIFNSHDRAFLGSRDDMERLFCSEIPKVMKANAKAEVVYEDLVCQSGDYEMCSQNIQYIPSETGVEEIRVFAEVDWTGEFMLKNVAGAPNSGFTLGGDGGLGYYGTGPLYGMDIRRYAYDYLLENKDDRQVGGGCDYDYENKLWKRLKEPFNLSSGWEYDGETRPGECGRFSGCWPYPAVKDRLKDSEVQQLQSLGVASRPMGEAH